MRAISRVLHTGPLAGSLSGSEGRSTDSGNGRLGFAVTVLPQLQWLPFTRVVQTTNQRMLFGAGL